MCKLAVIILVANIAIVSNALARADSRQASDTTFPSNPITVNIGFGWLAVVTSQHSLSQQALSTAAQAHFASASRSGDEIFAASIDYTFEKAVIVSRPLLPSIYADYFQDMTHGAAGLFGVGVAVRKYTSPPHGNRECTTYWGAGIGAYSQTTSASDTSFGAKVMGGIQFDRKWLAEANYTWAGTSGNQGIIALEGGYRF